MAKKRMHFSSAKAVRELGYRSRPAEEALRDALDWYHRNGYLAAMPGISPASSTPGQ
jgi:dihydroflavonol-4-reductase